jgi:tetratricopeptide (TPR) repeat protein
MSDWFRRTDWNEEIAADFEARLARSRASSQAQYLSLQGYALLGTHPQQAEDLLSRAVSAGDPSEVPRAACYLALSRVAQGKVDGAIQAYDVAIAAERRNPAFRSTAGVDQALLIALHDRRHQFGKALDQLAMAVADNWSLAGLEAVAAEAIIRHAIGDVATARQRAREALELLPQDPFGAEWAGISIDDLRARLEAIGQ